MKLENNYRQIFDNITKIYFKSEVFSDSDFSLMLYRKNKKAKGFTNTNESINADLVKEVATEGLETNTYIKNGKYYMNINYIFKLVTHDYMFLGGCKVDVKDNSLYITELK